MQGARRGDAGHGSAPGAGAPLKDDSPIANIRSTLMGLQPKLDAARYKAEAGLSRRGYVNHPRESLFHEEGEDLLMPPSDGVVEHSTGNSISDDGLGQDTTAVGENGEARRWNGNDEPWDEGRRGRSASAGGELRKERMKPWEVERDEMKWPVGEGWKPL